jgi:hypothetical protein
MFKTKEQFLMLLAACVVITTAFLIITKHLTADAIMARVEGARTYRSESAVELMKLLRQTVDDGGLGELQQLKINASGL